MKSLGLGVFLCALAVFGGGSRASALSAEVSKARETIERLDVALAPLRLGEYDKKDHDTVRQLLIKLDSEVGRLTPMVPSKQWVKLSTDVGQALLQENEFWDSIPKGRQKILHQTAQPLLQKEAKISSDFFKIFPQARSRRFSYELTPAQKAKIAQASGLTSRRTAAAAAAPGVFFDAGRSGTLAVGAVQRSGFSSRGRGNDENLPMEPTHKLRVGAVPTLSPDQACRQASGDAAFACGKNGSEMAPIMSGVFAAFKEQFGTVSGLVGNLLSMIGGLILGAMTGVGAILIVIKALAGVAMMTALAAGIRQLWAAFSQMRSAKRSDVHYWEGLRLMGKIGGGLLITALLMFVGYKIGSMKSVKKAIGPMTEALESKLGRPSPKPRAPASNVARKSSPSKPPESVSRKPAVREQATRRTAQNLTPKRTKHSASPYQRSLLTLEGEDARMAKVPARRPSAVRPPARHHPVRVQAVPPAAPPTTSPAVPLPTQNGGVATAMASRDSSASQITLEEKPAPAPSPARPSPSSSQSAAAVKARSLRVKEDIHSAQNYIRSILGDIEPDEKQTDTLVKEYLEIRGISPTSPRAQALREKMVPDLVAYELRAIIGVSPSLKPHAAALFELGSKHRMTPAAIDTALKRQGVIDQISDLDEETFKSHASRALRRDKLERIVARYPDNSQGQFMRNLAAEMTTPSGKSIEETTRDGVFAYADFDGASVKRVSVGRDPDDRTHQVVFYITNASGQNRWLIGGYHQNKQPRLQFKDARLIEFLKNWLISGGIPAKDFH